MKRIAIIGAGWAGLACLKRLRDDGHQVIVFERAATLGGVWSAEARYTGLTTHSPALTIEIPGFALPQGVDRFARMSAQAVCEYLEAWCDHEGLRTQLKTQCEVISLSAKSGEQPIEVQWREGGELKREGFDYVVNTAGWSTPHTPSFRGSDGFSGEIVHASAVTDQRVLSLIEQQKKVVVLGAGKSATDLVLAFDAQKYPVSWVYRRPYWFFNFTQSDRFLRNELSWARALWFRFSLFAGLALVALLPERLAAWGFGLLRRARLIHTFGPPHDDYSRFHHGRIGEPEMARLRLLPGQRCGDIAAMRANAITLSDGEVIDADVLVCCTGTGLKVGLPFEVMIDGAPIVFDRVYRHAVFTRMPRLISTFYSTFSFGMVNAVSRANWVSRFIRREVPAAEIEAESRPVDDRFWAGVFEPGRVFIKRLEEQTEEYIAHGELSRMQFRLYSAGQYFKRRLTPLRFRE